MRAGWLRESWDQMFGGKAERETTNGMNGECKEEPGGARGVSRTRMIEGVGQRGVE